MLELIARKSNNPDVLVNLAQEYLEHHCTSAKDMVPIGPFSKRHFSASCFSSLDIMARTIEAGSQQ